MVKTKKKPVRKTKRKTKRKKDKKRYIPRIFTNVKGRYIKIGNKRHYIKTNVSNKQLVKVVVNLAKDYKLKPKRRRRYKRKKVAKREEPLGVSEATTPIRQVFVSPSSRPDIVQQPRSSASELLKIMQILNKGSTAPRSTPAPAPRSTPAPAPRAPSTPPPAPPIPAPPIPTTPRTPRTKRTKQFISTKDLLESPQAQIKESKLKKSIFSLTKKNRSGRAELINVSDVKDSSSRIKLMQKIDKTKKDHVQFRVGSRGLFFIGTKQKAFNKLNEVWKLNTEQSEQTKSPEETRSPRTRSEHKQSEQTSRKLFRILNKSHNLQSVAHRLQGGRRQSVSNSFKLIADAGLITQSNIRTMIKMVENNVSSDEIQNYFNNQIVINGGGDINVESEKAKVETIPEESEDSNEDQESSNDQTGSGMGINTLEINDMMKKYKKFIRAYALDEFKHAPIGKKKQFGMIINLDDSSKPGSHWVALYIDKNSSVEYYDSFGREPTKTFLKHLQFLISRVKPSHYLKFKINKIVDQHVNTDSCGYLAMLFLIDRFKGKPFRECTGYNNVSKGERRAARFEKFGLI